jgi:hypothetical protein
VSFSQPGEAKINNPYLPYMLLSKQVRDDINSLTDQTITLRIRVENIADEPLRIRSKTYSHNMRLVPRWLKSLSSMWTANSGLTISMEKALRIGNLGQTTNAKQTVVLFIPVNPFNRLDVNVPWMDTILQGATVKVNMSNRYKFDEDQDIDKVVNRQYKVEPRVFKLDPDNVLPISLSRYEHMALELSVSHQLSIPVWEGCETLTTSPMSQMAQNVRPITRPPSPPAQG